MAETKSSAGASSREYKPKLQQKRSGCLEQRVSLHTDLSPRLNRLLVYESPQLHTDREADGDEGGNQRSESSAQ